MSRTKIVSHKGAPPFQRVEPTLLGRPFPLLSTLTPLMESKLANFIRHEINQRYRANFILHTLHHGLPSNHNPHWTWHRNGESTFGIGIERPLLLRILDYRYTTRHGIVSNARDASPLPVTQTELRLSRLLGEQITRCLLSCIDHLECTDPPHHASHDAVDTLPFPPSTSLEWEIRVEIGERGRDETQSLYIVLDRMALERVFKSRSGHPHNAQRLSHSSPLSLADQLNVHLRAQLVEKKLTLGDLADLKVGTILPIALQARANICIGPLRAFSALITEDHGKLCATSFNLNTVWAHPDSHSHRHTLSEHPTCF